MRLLVFRPPAVLIGYPQCVEEEVNVEECRRLGFDINRRITGGGAIIMGEEQPGWEIYVPEDHPLVPADVLESFEFFSRPVIRVLNYLGIEEAKFRPKNDIEVKGRKISGMGQYREAGGVQHVGTILLDLDVRLMLRLLKLPIEKLSDKAVKSFEERITTVKKEVGRVPSLEELKELFKRGFKEVYGVELVEGELTAEETAAVRELEGKRYGTDEWVYGLRAWQGPTTGQSVVKTPVGLIRVSARVRNYVVEHIMITGDFFAYPQRAIYDLEAAIKWSHVDEVPDIVRSFFKEGRICIPGLDPEDLVEAIMKAIRD
ncbi:lipoate--protein ligase family protein [Candidatus Bathyarchaeota archaeon]|nr:MAG: lipoate--protein ligase family protein [Candidatus Bathyarchaeota archaeon]